MTSLFSTGTSAVNRSILSCNNLEQVSDKILRPLCTLLGADSAVFIKLRLDSLSRPVVDASKYVGQDPESAADYIAGNYMKDPLIESIISSPNDWHKWQSPLTIHLRLHSATESFQQSGYYKRFIIPHNLSDVLAVTIPMNINGPQMICIGVHRTKNVDQFSDLHILALESITDSLSCALFGSCMQAEVKTQNAIIKTFNMHLYGWEYALLDRNLSIISATGRLKQLFVGNDNNTDIATSTIMAAASKLNAKMMQAIEPLRFSLPGGIVASLHCLDTDSERHYILSTNVRAALSFDDKLAQFADVTIRERQVIRLVTQGLKNKAISDVLDISTRTVENHLRSIFDKLDVTSRTCMINKISGEFTALQPN
jgi:DNA-binding NarL/FixJ family response regulator